MTFPMVHTVEGVPLAPIRELIESLEDQQLSPFATRSSQSRGRQEEETRCPIRTVFQRDRDRILHAKAFRRLKGKTQVFISPVGDHYRTRLTHSLEVSQIARTIARALQLNEDLTEAIALGHDIGHPPFGHAGEAVLDELCSQGFSHTDHSVRIATLLEPLNLTQEVLDGMAQQASGSKPVALEGQVVEVADRFAYLNHDVEDAIRAGLMAEEDLPPEIQKNLGKTRQERLDTLVMDLIQTTRQHFADRTPEVKVSPRRYEAMMALRQWMFDHVYLSATQHEESKKVRRVLVALYQYFLHHPEQLPPRENIQESQASNAFSAEKDTKDNLERWVVDYIAGMTDRFAMDTYLRILMPAASRHHTGMDEAGYDWDELAPLSQEGKNVGETRP